MYWILVHVTGIPPLEAQMLRSRGERYRDYQSRTSAFFPAAAARSQEGSGHMSFVSTIIGTAERVPLPDVIDPRRDPPAVLAHRHAARHRQRAKAMPAFADEMAARAIAEHTDAANAQHYEVPAAFFAHVLGPEPQIFLLLLQGAGLDAAGGRGRGAAPDRRARRPGRRAIDPRTRLRLGFAVAVDGAAVSECAGHGGVQFALAARIYRGRSRAARPDQSARRHRRHERVRARRRSSTASSRSRCSST